jgi:hypothetical protein
VGLDGLCDTLSREGLLTEPSFDVVQDFSVGGVGFIQNIFELQVRRTKTVAEVLSKDPATV